MLVAMLPGLALILICFVSLAVRGQDSATKPSTSRNPASGERTPKVQNRRAGTLQQGADRVSKPEDGFVEQAPLTFSGRGNLSFCQGDLIFIPDGKEVDRVMGLPVVFDAQGRPSPTDVTGREEELFGFVGQIDMRFDLRDESLQVSAQSDDGRVIERRFDLFFARPESGTPISNYVQSYFTYMATGRDPETGAGGQESSEGGVAMANNCNCATDYCSHQQSCKDTQVCKCGCKGQTCNCWCTNAM